MADTTTRQSGEHGARRLRVTQVRSGIGGTHRQRASLHTLGLRRIRQSVVREDSPSVRGLIAKVRHLVTVEEV
ncbi:50S ribosomal protein L30 [Actinomyces sp. 2119]|uniref:50S ribosomal protein L30 n=1 Tax=Actinomyces sp. 2119 TaxID=2321393 RepID=UPI000E6C90AB|nr:50S ribosomal protein L30 [Actinomyces sp. 2119]RJF40744.1 50S ribosomal protein L30 [Actinomyces sp. 2119]